MNDELNEQVIFLKQKIDDWKEYAEDLEKESETLLEAETKNAELLDAIAILEQQLDDAVTKNEKITSQANQNKDSLAHMLDMETKEQKRLSDQCSDDGNQMLRAEKRSPGLAMFSNRDSSLACRDGVMVLHQEDTVDVENQQEQQLVEEDEEEPQRQQRPPTPKLVP